MKTTLDTLSGHLQDLAERSYQNNIYTFSNFLGEAELDLLMSLEKELRYAGITLFGGSEHADRCMVRFGREADLGYTQTFPIACLQIEPLVMKFGEELSHRDYLGALMNLGIERDLLGDIYIDGKTAYLFCVDHIAIFLQEHLTQVRHTNVKVSVLDQVPENAGPRLVPMTIIAASERLDAVIAKIGNLSRSQSQQLFRSGKVFVNGRQWENSSYSCKRGDKISLRGTGKFIYDGVEGTTGKGRCRIRIQVYQ